MINEPQKKAKEVVGIPEKGRNASYALRQELNGGVDSIIKLLNGKGKRASKTGEGLEEIKKTVESKKELELKEYERKYPRPVINKFRVGERVLVGYEEDPQTNDFDRFYQGLDEFVEENFYYENIDDDFESLAGKFASQNGYMLEEVLNMNVKWSPMSTDLSMNPRKVLISSEFENISKRIALDYWTGVQNFEFFESFNEKSDGLYNDEEEIIASTSQNTAGVYMYVSGNTAEEHDLEYEKLDDFISGLGHFKSVEKF